MVDDQKIVDELIESLSENDRLRRKHASFWNFHKKTSKELGLFSEVFDRFKTDLKQEIMEWGLCDTDPPDIFAKLADGSLIGIEITELVNEKAIQAQIRRDPNYYDELFRFDYDAAVSKLRNILTEKEKKLYKEVFKFDGLSLLIHTDEFLLNSDIFIGKESDIFPEGSNVFESVYILFSYEPKKQKSPMLRLI